MILDTELFSQTEYSEGECSCEGNSAAGRNFWILEGKHFKLDAHGSIQGVHYIASPQHSIVTINIILI